MGETLVGKSTVTFVWIASNENAVEALRVFFQGHYEFMKEKSYREGPLKLLQYTISESPEYKEVGPFFEGKFPETTGRTVFTLFEIYETADGIHHHWIESAPWAGTFTEVIDAHKIELQMFNQMKVIQSLWD